MNAKANEITSQLRGIKRALIFSAACLFVTAVSNIYYMVDDMRENQERRLGRTFYQQADSLYREREWDQLLALSLNRQRTNPRDADAFFWAGVSYHELGQLDQAEEAFKNALERNPRGKQSIQQWMKSLQKKREAQKKQ